MPGAIVPREYNGGTVGAGDAFTAGVLLGAHRDSTLEEALTYATARADLSLSRINADTVTAWYAADAQAAALLEEFEAGSEETLEATLPMTERQSLYVRFQREADGTVTVLDWRTVLTEEDGEGSSLPVYGSEG